MPLTHPNNIYFEDINTSSKNASPSKSLLYNYPPFFDQNPDNTDTQFSKHCKILNSSVLSKFVVSGVLECVYRRNSYEEVYEFQNNSVLVAGSTLGTSKF